jgi:glutaminyl-peptide cyclotransferase
VDLIDFDYPNASNAYWHTLQDTPDKCSPRSLAAVGTVLLHIIYANQAN